MAWGASGTLTTWLPSQYSQTQSVFVMSKIPRAVEGSEPVEARLGRIGLQLPPVPTPVAEYVPAKQVGNIVYVSGQGPIVNGRPALVGRVGAELSLEQGYLAARLCILNALAAVKEVIGSLDHIAEVVQVRGFVNSAPDFHDQPKVINGASELLVYLFGERGRHARAALGTHVLPGNIPVEIELVVRVDGRSRKEGVRYTSG